MTDSQNSNQQSVSRILANVQPSIRDFLSPIINLDDSGQFFEATCPFCTHPLRSEAEVFYNSLEKVLQNRCEKLQTWFLVDKGVANLPLDVIRNHVNNHMGRGDAEFRKVEYINKIRNLSSIEMGTFERIKFALAALSERLTAIASCPAGDKNPIKTEALKAKTINDLLKTWTSLVALQSEMLGEMIGKGEVVSIHKEDFDRAIGNALANAKTDGERELISSFLKQLEEAELDRVAKSLSE